MSTANPFQKATRRQLKARVALDGPTGSGKTWTGLEWATVLADGGRIAVIDTERGSAALYSDRFDFDVLAMEPPYEPAKLVEHLKAAEAHGYQVVLIDSLSHFWEGEGGTLDIVDGAAQRSGGNQFAGWKVGTPALRHLVDTMLGLDAHVIATMRSKMEYVLAEDSRGKKVPQKVGMAPVMRAGVEYEFTLVGDLDLEHRLVISKSRCDALADEMVQPGRAGEAAKRFQAWLADGEPLAAKADVDALIAQMNTVTDEEARTAIKQGFVERFGRPDQLLASRLDEAREHVAAQVASVRPPDDDGPGAGAPVGDDDPPPDGGGAGEASDPDGPGVAAHQGREAEQEGPAGEPAASRGNAAHDGGTTPEVDVPDGPSSSTPPASSDVDVEDLRALMADVAGWGEAKVLRQARRIAEEDGHPVPNAFGELEPGPLLDEVYRFVEQLLAAQRSEASPAVPPAGEGGGPAVGGDVPQPSSSGPATREQTQKALIIRIKDAWPGSEKGQADRRHALARFVSKGRTGSSSDLSKDELVEAHRVLERILDPAGGLRFSATSGSGAFAVVEAQGAAA